MTNKKTKFFIACGLVAIILATLLSNYFSFSPILNACVNPINGHVAIAYYENDRDGVMVKSFDADGTRIISYFFDTSGSENIYLMYENNSLVVYPRIKSSDSKSDFYYFDEEGILFDKKFFDENSSQVQLMRNTEWKDWQKSSNNRSYVTNEHTYCYEESSFWIRLIGRGSCRFYVQSEEGNQIELYQNGTGDGSLFQKK